jgi:hypothetical protein
MNPKSIWLWHVTRKICLVGFSDRYEPMQVFFFDEETAETAFRSQKTGRSQKYCIQNAKESEETDIHPPRLGCVSSSAI